MDVVRTYRRRVVPVTEVGPRATSFAHRLRADTADLHGAVEAVADLPGSVTSRAAYGDLLLTFQVIHGRVEAALCAPEWERDWRHLGVNIAAHRQLPRLASDLAELGADASGRSGVDRVHAAPVATRTAVAGASTTGPGLTLESSAEALGCLYVVEGSAIGRRVLSPLLRARLGDVPTSFFDGTGRQPRAWLDVQRCLAGATDDAGRQRAVLAGARRTFQVFLDQFRERSHRRVLVSP